MRTTTAGYQFCFSAGFCFCFTKGSILAYGCTGIESITVEKGVKKSEKAWQQKWADKVFIHAGIELRVSKAVMLILCIRKFKVMC